jgi:quinol monooxygenase YgiN
MNTMRVVAIRSYKLKPDSADVFHALVAEQSVPLHRAAGIDVVACGTSLHDADAYFLIRAYESMEHLQRSQGSVKVVSQRVAQTVASSVRAGEVRSERTGQAWCGAMACFLRAWPYRGQ